MTNNKKNLSFQVNLMHFLSKITKNCHFLSKKIIKKLVFLGQFNAFLNKNVQKMVNFCQKW